MAGLGTVFVELELDRSKFDASLRKLETDAKTMPIQIEDAFKSLAVKSSYQFDLMREKAVMSFERIKNAANATANDRLRAEQAMHAQITRLNEEQYGRQRDIFSHLKTSLESIAPGFAGLVTGVGAFTAALGAAGTAAVASLNTFKTLAFQTRDLSFISGGTAEQVSGLIDVLDDFGVESSTVERAMVFLSRAVQDGSPALDRLGISIRNNSGHLKTAHDLFYEVVDALSKMGNSTERNAIAQELFSRGWTAMVPVIEKGSAALKEAADTSKLVMTADDLKRADEYRQSLAELADTWELLKIRIGRGIVAPITFFLQGATGGNRSPQDLRNLTQEQIMGAMGLPPELQPGGAGLLPGIREQSFPAGGVPEGLTPGELKKRQEEQKELAKTLADSQKYSADAAKDELASLQGSLKATDEIGRLTDENAKKDIEAVNEKAKALDALGEDSRKTAEEELRGLDAISKEINKLQEDTTETGKAELKAREDAQKEFIKNWVAIIEDQEERDFEAAKALADAQGDAAKRSEDAWKKSMLNIRGVTEDAFAGMSGAISTAIRGVIQGTQTVEQAFKRMGENILLGVMDSVVNRAIGSISSSLMDAVFGKSGGGGGGINWGGLGMSALSAVGSMAGGIGSVASSVASGVGSAVSSVGSFLGFLDTGMWKVPAGKSSATAYTGRWKLPGANTASTGTNAAAGIAILHPGEMVVPPDLADKLRRLVALTGGSDFGGLNAILSDTGSGRGASSLGGQYGSMTQGQRDALGSLATGFGAYGAIGSLASALGYGALSAGTLGAAFGRATVGGILGIDAMLGPLGIASVGFKSPSEADFQAERDMFGAYREAEARAAAAAAESAFADMQNAATTQAQADLSAQGPQGAMGVDGAAAPGVDTEGAPSFGEGGYGESSSNDKDGGGGYGGSGSGEGGPLARGAVFNTRGRTRLTVGEAGTETVAVLRNPRDGSFGGGGSIQVNFDLRGAVMGNELPTNTIRTIRRQLERLESRTLRY